MSRDFFRQGEAMGAEKHMTSLDVLTKYFDGDRERMRKYFTFTFVRNPWDRLVSWYHFIGQNDWHARTTSDAVAEVHKTPFCEWVMRHQMPPQLDHIMDRSGAVLVQFAGKVENIQYDFDHVCRAIGVPYLNMEEKTNTSRHLHYSTYYSREAKELVADIYKHEIALFKYAFDDKPNQPDG